MANNGNNANIANANMDNNNAAPVLQSTNGNNNGIEINEAYQATFSDFSLKMGECTYYLFPLTNLSLHNYSTVYTRPCNCGGFYAFTGDEITTNTSKL